MGNGYGFFGYGVVKTTFLLGDTEYMKREQSCAGGRTSTIYSKTSLSGSRYWNQVIMLHSSSTHNRKTAYFWNTGDPRHLYLVVSPVVRVVRKGFCCSSDSSAPEKDALRSEALDENALIQHGFLFQ